MNVKEAVKKAIEHVADIFESENPDKLAATIKKVVSMDRDSLEKLKKHARELIEMNFSAKRVAISYLFLPSTLSLA